MTGPKPLGYWSSHGKENWDFLSRGNTYSVIKEFLDHDDILHPVGETWIFAGYSYLPHDDGLSLFVQKDGGEWHLRLQLSADEQKEISDNLRAYLKLVK